MKKYHLASKLQRTIAFVLDGAIIVGLGILFSWIIIKFSGYDAFIQEKANAYSAIKETSPSEAQSILNEYALLTIGRASITSGILLILTFVYWIIFPMCFSWQTLGRFLTKTSVLVAKTNQKPTMKHLLIRELLGEYFFYILITVILYYLGFVFLNFVFWISCASTLLNGISFIDRLSKTKFVDLNEVESNEVTDDFEEFDEKMAKEMEAEMRLLEGDIEQLPRKEEEKE